MSIKKRPDSKFWQYVFQIDGIQFRRATPFEWRTTPKRTAQRWEAELKVAKRKEIAEANRTGGKTLSTESVTIEYAFKRYWDEVGEKRVDRKSVWKDLRRILEQLPSIGLSPENALGDINDNIMAKLIAWRRSNHIKNDPQRPLVSDATVNRSLTERLQQVFSYARNTMLKGIQNPFPFEPTWPKRFLKEAKEHPRMLMPEELGVLVSELSADYERLMRFSILSGLRQQESLIKKSSVKWSLGIIETVGKGNKSKTTYITPGIEKILRECWNDHPESVFTFVADRTIAERRHIDKASGQEIVQQTYVKGKRYPITASGLKTHWRRKRSNAAEVCPSVADYRWHDHRHTFGSNSLNSSGNIKVVQDLMGHADSDTTAVYAHLFNKQAREAMVQAEKDHYLTGLAEGPKLLPPPEQKAG